MFIYQILEKYNKAPYYNSDNYISINDDRVGTIVSFKLYKENDSIYADFTECSKYQSYYNRSKKCLIISVEDFQNKWHNFYNNISIE